MIAYTPGTDAILTPAKPHPRAWGSMTRYLGFYARDIFDAADTRVTGPDGGEEIPPSDQYPAPFPSIADALEEVTLHLASRPAGRLGLIFELEGTAEGPQARGVEVPRIPRGLVKEGYAADLVLFNPDTVKDIATFDDPNQPSRGIEWVLVNGRVAVEKGKVTGTAAGRTIRRRKKEDGSGGVWQACLTCSNLASGLLLLAERVTVDQYMFVHPTFVPQRRPWTWCKPSVDLVLATTV
jgi:N-acyl-D-amino-acid deacylase